MQADFEKTRAENTVANRGHHFKKEKTLQIKEFLEHNEHVEKIISSTLQTKRKLFKKTGTLQGKELHTANKTPARYKQETNCKKMEHCKQKNYTLQTKLQHATNKKQTVKKWNTANKRITRFKLNSRKLQTTFSSPEAALLLVSTKNCDLLSRFLAWSNEIPVLNGFVNTID